MRTIYQNYNCVEEDNFKGERVVIKRFKEEFCWENETKVMRILHEYGFPVPEILSSSKLLNIYSFFDMPKFSNVLKDRPDTVHYLLDLLPKIQKVKSRKLHTFNPRVEKLVETGESLFNNGEINKDTLDGLKRLCITYQQPPLVFCHGDFRPDNVFYHNGVGGLIDFEFSGMDDPNKDLAYLWVGTVQINKGLNHYLKDYFRKFDFFNDSSFTFWLGYVHSMILSNPNTQNKKDWALNLEVIVRDSPTSF